MEKKIVRPDGTEYMTVAADGDTIEFRNFSHRNVTVRFDAKVLDQLIPFLTEINFWLKTTKGIKVQPRNNGD
jgi:hypothetical protein